jgi:hypothetical protein
LSDQPWAFIDLSLKAFGFPRTNSWSGADKEGYVVEMIGDGDAQPLIDLGLHVGYKFDAPPLAVELRSGSPGCSVSSLHTSPPTAHSRPN